MTGRLAIVVVALALAIAACDRVVELFPSPDGGIDDAAFVPDGGPGDAHLGNDGNDGSLVLPDANVSPDAG